ncbi:Threonine/homoserine efflux transporter RhtA [Alteribacillus persepolensis]|uniref:Threonine/homoserine efflux transporter RhtA n=1 Tax=Alteribacillus persepolensis TaxID=568899 RepID=A0A1G8G431_9BACI|nr:EamA family transporter [Alteribacillus persepolensis]SDH89081.1 Threonine/homoserine efflux transporter RhtA [Alteribacillus persepolensis]
MTRKQAYLCAVAGAALWGLIGIFVQVLYNAGFTPWQTVAIRMIFSVVLIVGCLALWKPSLLKIRWKDIPFFIGTGIISIVFFNWCYFTVMDEATVSLAVVLLYTGPLFVTIISRFLFQEWLTKRKILSLVFTITGCAFAVGLLPAFQTNVSWFIILVGIGSGFFYALYSIFGKYVSSRYSSLTITAYSFICASVLMIPAGGLASDIDKLLHPDVMLYVLGLAFIATVLGYILYTAGLAHIESSRAAILTTIEPVVAITVGITLFGDTLNPWQILGVVLVLASIFLIAEKPPKHQETS